MSVFAIGDIHGDLTRAQALLCACGLIDNNGTWIGNDQTLICIGDLTDRGQRGIEVIQFVMRLQREASKDGGEVECLMGNHDALILSAAYTLNGAFCDRECLGLFVDNGGRMEEARHLANDVGMLRWIKARPLVTKIANVLFQHADGMNYYTRLGSSVQDINKAGLALARTPSGAWSIFYNMTDERYWAKGVDKLPSYLERFGCNMVVHGHTRLRSNQDPIYLDGMAVNIDQGLSLGYGTSPTRGCVAQFDYVGDNLAVHSFQH